MPIDNEELPGKPHSLLSLVVALALPQLIGGLGAIATGSSISTWYRRLRKPSWDPPSRVFAPVWTTLYLLMGLASWLIWRQGQVEKYRTPVENRVEEKRVRTALGLYSFQLALNLLWSVIFFGLRRAGWALAEISLLWALILGTLRRFYQINPIAGLLLVPYQLWTTFAAALNAGIWWLNRKG